ncbi:hypothetical protein AB0I97_04415 [Streptomyces sp. NPDC049951]|uniref:hypothetical protein n=1 Tax=Streptomyces sp. NPDC049951 TaxID=3156660 RepID=UPI00342F22C1
MQSEKKPTDLINSESPLFTVEEQLKEAGAVYSWAKYADDSACFLKVEMKAGRKVRTVLVGEREAPGFIGIDFTRFRGVGDYEAYEEMGEEAVLEVALTGYGPGVRFLEKIPGWVNEESEAGKASRLRGYVQLNGSRGERWSAEIGTPSRKFSALANSSSVALRLKGGSRRTHDEALKFLESVGNSVLFEFDLNYGISLTMRRVRSASGWRPVRRVKRSDLPPVLPRLEYGAEPLSLYSYARSAQGMPLLEFLAYYQVLEYHFSRYSQRDLLDKLRNELRDPTFRADDDRHLSRILGISRQAGKGYGDERSQLKSTVRYCVSEDVLFEFFELNDEVYEHYGNKKQPIKGLPPLDVKSKKGDLLGVVCERIYDIRCRVVHSKEDGGGQGDSLLMPFSPEAESLRAENVLMRFLAQKVLIAGAKNLAV